MADDDRNQGMIRQVLEFMVKFFAGNGEEPTQDKPVVEVTSRTERVEVKVKKVVDFDHDKKVKELAEKSMRIKESMPDIIAAMKAKVAQDEAREREKNA